MQNNPIITQKENKYFFKLAKEIKVAYLAQLELDYSLIIKDLLDQHKEVLNCSDIEVYLDAAFIEQFDQAGVIFLFELKQLIANKMKCSFINTSLSLRKALQAYELKQDKVPITMVTSNAYSPKIFLARLGENMVDFYNNIKSMTSFFGHLIVMPIIYKDCIRLKLISIQIDKAAIKSFFIINLLSFMIGCVMAFMGGVILKQFNATILIVNFVSIGILREFGVLSVAILIAGRSGSSFTAIIGSMKLNEEIDAMKLMGANPFNILILPRILALIISMPLLTVFSVFFGMLGGIFVSISITDINLNLFLIMLHNKIGLFNFWVGLIKAPFFALAIGVVSCYQGLMVERSAEDLGRRTTYSVVQSLLMVILFDAVFAIIFKELGL